MSELDVNLAGKSLADFTNTQLRLALGAVLYTNTADMWRRYLNQLGYSGDVSQMLQKYYVEYSVPQNFRNYINAGAFIYSPQQLFTDGSKGVVYDNNDLSSFYLDSAGTTAATVNGLVGLQLDKSQGLATTAPSIDGVMNTGTWTKGTGWTATGPRSISCDGTNGASSDVGAVYSKPANTFVRYTFNIVSITGTLSVYATQSVPSSFTTTGRKQVYSDFGADFNIFRATAGTVVVVEDIRIEIVSGNHRYQTTTGSKPVLRGTPTGANLVTNGDFASGTANWTANNVTIAKVGSNLRITSTAAGFVSAYQTISGLTPSGWYRLRGSAQRLSGTGPSYLRFYDTAPSTTPVAGPYFSSTGTLVTGDAYFQASADGTITLNLAMEAATGAGVEAEFGPITLHDVSAGSVTAPYGLQYDGVDDFLQTAAVDFTATDKACLVIGTRKLSDASTGVVASLGSVGVTNGSFEFRAPWTNATADIGMGMKGPSGTSSATYTTFTAPITNVFTFSMDFAGGNLTEIAARANGVALTASGLDTGVSQFANQPLYFGRRTGTILPYTGLEYGLVICGKTLTSTQISQTERYIAQRTGISL